jgi:hypothetical protein
VAEHYLSYRQLSINSVLFFVIEDIIREKVVNEEVMSKFIKNFIIYDNFDHRMFIHFIFVMVLYWSLEEANFDTDITYYTKNRY